jgi:hypothetical protein
MTFHFGGHLFINPEEVMFTSAGGFGEHHFLGVDKSQCPPYEKSLLVSSRGIDKRFEVIYM